MLISKTGPLINTNKYCLSFAVRTTTKVRVELLRITLNFRLLIFLMMFISPVSGNAEHIYIYIVYSLLTYICNTPYRFIRATVSKCGRLR